MCLLLRCDVPILQGHLEVIAPFHSLLYFLCCNMQYILVHTHSHARMLLNTEYTLTHPYTLSHIFTHSPRFRVAGISTQRVGCIVFPWRSIFSPGQKKGQLLKYAIMFPLTEKKSHILSCRKDGIKFFPFYFKCFCLVYLETGC